MTELNLNEIKAHHERTVAAEGDQLTVSEHERGLLLAEVEKLRAQLNTESDVFYLLRDERDYLARQLESATASVVSLSSRRQVLEARCEQMEADHAETVAELEKLRAELAEMQHSKNEVGSWLDQTIESRRKERERAQRAEAKVHAVETLRVWKNEDGKRFLFADDVFAALRGGEQP